jgi:hypothetical protein
VPGTATHTSIYSAGAWPAIELPHNFSFVLNVSRLVVQAPVVTAMLAPGHELRKATQAEVLAIKEVLTKLAAITNWFRWEADPVKEGTKTSWPRIAEDRWRYFVITFEGSNATAAEIKRTLCIAPSELKIGFTLMRRAFPSKITPTLVYHGARLFTQAHAAANGHLPFLDITNSDVEAISALHYRIRAYDQTTININRLMDQVLDLDALPYESPLTFLGYFAILESVLTHNPKPTDTIDSITRQVKQKVLLLNNRWQPRLDYSQFGASKPDAVWSKMYSYRSCLAHGGMPDFKGDLQLLGDRDGALNLLKQAVKGVLRQALIEPQLILDLRNC